MAAQHADMVFSPEPQDRLQILLQPRHSLCLGRAEALEFDFSVAQSGAEYQPPTANHIEGGELLCNIQRFMQR